MGKISISLHQRTDYELSASGSSWFSSNPACEGCNVQRHSVLLLLLNEIVQDTCNSTTLSLLYTSV